MKKVWLLVISVALVLVVGLAGCSSGGPTSGETPANLKVNLNSQQEGIWVTGTGKVSDVPDIATLSLGIEAQETSVAEAQVQAAEAMDRVMTALTDNGVAKKDIQTQYFNIRRVTKWDNVKEQEVVIGYRVTNMVTAKIRDIDNIGAVIDAVAVAGGDFTRIDNIGFSVEDPSGYHQEARQKAIADAKAKAEQLADLAGVKLGKPTYITENAHFPSPIYPQVLYERAAGASVPETPISAGEMEISLTIQLVYAILD
ncbi:SIMPL domain-containing protein [Chloroflexota bacterium]